MPLLRWLNSKFDDKMKRQIIDGLIERQLKQNRSVKDKLETIYIFLTRKCNLSCQHCYIKGVGSAIDSDFDLQMIKRLIAPVIPYGLKKIKISGGEPFIRPDLFDILTYFNDLGLEIVLETNGTLYNEKIVSSLNLFENFTIFVSLDHSKRELHDFFRGVEGSFDKTVDLLKELGHMKVPSVVTTIANQYNHSYILEIIELVLSLGIQKHRTLLNIHPLCNAHQHLDNALTLEEIEVLVEAILQSSYFLTSQAYMTLPPALMPLESLNEINLCGWGTNVLGILSNGDVTMCSASYDDKNMIAGNAFEHDLISLWEKSVFFNNLRRVAHGKVKGICSNCIFYIICQGVCRMSSYAHYGEIDAPYPLCQEFYNADKFPAYALLSNEMDCHYFQQKIKYFRNATFLST